MLASSLVMKPTGRKLHPRKLSHSLSYVLRHGAIELGLPMTPDGFVPVSHLLKDTKFQGVSVEDLQEVVENNDKKRFKMVERPGDLYGMAEDTVLCIRANQGHTIAIVDPEALCRRLKSSELREIDTIVHGTYTHCWSSIKRQGLSKMRRQHIHFAKGMPGEDGVISGMRKTCDIYIYLDTQKCAEDDIVFYESENGVILTAGKNGFLAKEYFSQVVHKNGERLLDQGMS